MLVKTNPIFAFAGFFFVVFIITNFVSGRKCGSSGFRLEMKGRYLKDHLIETMGTETASVCRIMCYLNESCMSYNYQASTRKCELSDANELNHPEDLVNKTGYDYVRREGQCTTDRCKNNGTCKEMVNDFRCHCPQGFTGKQCEAVISKNCFEAFANGGTKSGVYTVDPGSSGPFEVYCDQETKGSGWAVIQRRQDGSVDFYRGWHDYKTGFGNLTGEFWLGLDKIYRLTYMTHNRLRVELEDWDDNTAYAEYDYFAVADRNDNYKLSLGNYKGTAGDSLGHYHQGMAFSTKDHDRDKNMRGNCAVKYQGAWWYKACHESNLNGLYHQNGNHSSYADGVNWKKWKGYHYSVKRAEMKIRPL